MLQPEAAHFQLCEPVELSCSSLNALVDLLRLDSCSKVKTQNHPEQIHAANQLPMRERPPTDLGPPMAGEQEQPLIALMAQAIHAVHQHPQGEEDEPS